MIKVVFFTYINKKNFLYHTRSLALFVPEMKIAEFANNADLDEVAHNEPSHLDLHILPFSF